MPVVSIKTAKFVKWSHSHVTLLLSRDASWQPSVDQPPPSSLLKFKQNISRANNLSCNVSLLNRAHINASEFLSQYINVPKGELKLRCHLEWTCCLPACNGRLRINVISRCYGSIPFSGNCRVSLTNRKLTTIRPWSLLISHLGSFREIVKFLDSPSGKQSLSLGVFFPFSYVRSKN